MTIKPSKTLRINIVQGNITQQFDCDGVVNSANEYLIAGSGVCGAIHKAAGRELETYCKTFAPLGLGEALATPAFGIAHCRTIIHTRAPRYWQDADPAENLACAIRNSVRLADQNGIQRLAVPAIAMGVYRYPAEDAVPILVKTVRRLEGDLSCLQEVRFVVLGQELLSHFQRAIA